MKSHTSSKKPIILNPKDSLSDIVYQIKSYSIEHKKTKVYIPNSIYTLYNKVNRDLFINSIKQLSDKYDINLYSTDGYLINLIQAEDINVKYIDSINLVEDSLEQPADDEPYTDFLAYKQIIQDNPVQHSVQSEPVFESSTVEPISKINNQKKQSQTNSKPLSKTLLYLSIILGIVFASLLSLIFIPKADIIIKTTTEELSKDFEITFDPNITDVSVENRTIPSTVDTISASVEGTYEATGSQTGGTKSGGAVTRWL